MSVLWVAWGTVASAQHHHAEENSSVTAPKIFLDKSPRIVEYQLKRLTSEQLLLVERSDDDVKYAPVYQAILMREGISRAYRDEALAGLVKLNASDAVSELLLAMRAIEGNNASAQRMHKGLATMLLEQPRAELANHAASLQELAAEPRAELAAVGNAALITAGQTQIAWEQAEQPEDREALLKAIALVPQAELRAALHPRVLPMLAADQPLAVRRAALASLAHIPAQPAETFQLAASLIREEGLRQAAVTTLLSVPATQRPEKASLELIEWLVAFAEQTPAADRTQNAFLDAMTLVDQLLARAPSDFAKRYRERLRETVVRVVQIRTVEEEMRYDIPYFAVEAGRSVQIALINEDIMPHNLVITAPGALQEVAELGLEAGPEGGESGKQYVPTSDKVLFATDMVPSAGQERLTFTAPSQPGEYPYVCTFPRHWMRMYGVMVVVDDLDAWLKNPVEPTDPIGSNRHFVQSWSLDDFRSDLATGLRGRSPQIGEKLFVEATCAQCHKAGTAGVGNVGPDLSQTFQRWKGDPAAVLQEILDPSHRIDDKYAVHLILTVDGQTVSGLIVEDQKDHVALMENPEAKQPTIVPKEDIEQMVKTSNSMMPKGLLDRFSKDEVFEILAFIQNIQP